MFIGVVFGGRIGYFLLYSPASWIEDPLTVLCIWEGGMASHGGFAGCFLAMIWIARKHGVDWKSLADVIVTLAPPGFFFGRVANFINGELWERLVMCLGL
jgi:phosphatidylglycerol:prolipoprotein diacylglycerol transferase